jgi:hypothetical protein
MDNPWLNLKLAKPPFVLDCDLDFVEDHNKWAGPDHKIMDHSIPEPFIGNPDTATLVLLRLNAGHGPNDETDHKRANIRAAMPQNLYWADRKYPLYPYDPVFVRT